jgi:hypothetical protein
MDECHRSGRYAIVILGTCNNFPFVNFRFQDRVMSQFTLTTFMRANDYGHCTMPRENRSLWQWATNGKKRKCDEEGKNTPIERILWRDRTRSRADGLFSAHAVEELHPSESWFIGRVFGEDRLYIAPLYRIIFHPVIPPNLFDVLRRKSMLGKSPIILSLSLFLTLFFAPLVRRARCVNWNRFTLLPSAITIQKQLRAYPAKRFDKCLLDNGTAEKESFFSKRKRKCQR